MNGIMEKEWLYGKTLEELKVVAANVGAKPFVAKQLADWLYKKEVCDINLMTNLSLALREKLNESYQVGQLKYIDVQVSKDGTKKYLYPTINGNSIESAYIPEEDRATLCVSSQAGCKMGCKFCMTARQGFQQNLSSGEILNQIREIDDREGLNNVVYMGMGEPFDNIDEVLRSIEILTATWGYAWSPSRITVSSIGILSSLKRYLEEAKSHLTISLHSSFAEDRAALMPSQKKNPISEIIEEIRKYDFTHQRRVSFAYLLFKGVNDTRDDVDNIAELLEGIPCRINLIPFHAIPDTDLVGASKNSLVQFRDALTKRGFIATIRASRGEDIDAACGLLSTKEQQKRNN